MGRPQLLVTFGGILLVLAIYHLPRVVVENESQVDLATHDFTISEEDADIMSSLRVLLTQPNKEKNSNFADSLAGYFLKYGVLDSAQVLAEVILREDSSLTGRRKAIEIMYSVFERSLDREDASKKAANLRPIIEEALSRAPGDLALKNKLAMTLVTTENPMVGINLLREIVAEDATNREALINLGLLAIRSGQFARAVQRFNVLLELDSTDFETKLYLGVALVESGEVTQADSLFKEIVEASDADPAIRQSAQEYLSRN